MSPIGKKIGFRNILIISGPINSTGSPMARTFVANCSKCPSFHHFDGRSDEALLAQTRTSCGGLAGPAIMNFRGISCAPCAWPTQQPHQKLELGRSSAGASPLHFPPFFAARALLAGTDTSLARPSCCDIARGMVGIERKPLGPCPRAHALTSPPKPFKLKHGHMCPDRLPLLLMGA